MSRDIFPSDEIVASLMDAGGAITEPTFIAAADDAQIAAVFTVPDGYQAKVIDLDAIRAPYRPGPVRFRGKYVVRDVASFLAYYGKHAENTAEIWVATKDVTAVLNAHQGIENGAARWEDHRLVLQLVHSPEWIRWTGISGQFLSQEKFAEFLEDCVGHILAPDMATVLEVAQSLQATVKVDFKSAYRTPDGRRSFRYEETATAKAGQKGELEIPERLTLSLRVYEGQQPAQITARFRYRLTGDNLLLGIVIDQIPEILEAALAEVKIAIGEGIDRGDVYTGTPA